jgi:signal transduction histidine kinase
VADTDTADGAIEVEGAFGHVPGDEVLLRQAFDNLLRNAVEACSVAGIVPRVRVRGEPRPADGVVRVTVEDNGPGLPPGDRERLFQPFVTTRSRGTGLGLALVQKIVVTHDGQVRAGDAPGGGACFTVHLPLSAGH